MTNDPPHHSTILRAIVTGLTTTFTGDVGWLVSHDGWDAVEPEWITTRGPQQDGDTIVGRRLAPRKASLILGLEGRTLAELITKRRRIGHLFRPAIKPITLQWDLPTGDTRMIDVYIDGRITMGPESRRGFTQRVGIPLRAPDPTFYTQDILRWQYKLSGAAAAGGTTIPMPIPTPIGASQAGTRTTIDYDGEWRDYPIIYVRGPFAAFTILNISTGKRLSFPNLTLGAGEQLIIDCRYGHKTVTTKLVSDLPDTPGVNRIAEPSADAHLSTWALEADPEVLGGKNDLEIIGTGAGDATEVFVLYRHRTLGI